MSPPSTPALPTAAGGAGASSQPPSETTQLHTRLLKCALELEESRAYWQHRDSTPPTPQVAFERYWFGARSLPRIECLLVNLKARFDAFPGALAVLQGWPAMPPDTRRVLCHAHLQLSDPLYRAFTGDYLVARHEATATVTRDLVIAFVTQAGPDRWTLPTRIKFASKLLSAAYAAGLVATTRDPRPLRYPAVPDDALAYLLYLLREVRFAGTLLDNPYLRSLGLTGAPLEERLRSLPALRFQRQGDIVDFGWRYPSLTAWATAHHSAGGHA